MQTPTKVHPAELVKELTIWLMENARRISADEYQCAHCGERLCAQDVRFSIHAEEFGDACAGAGKVRTFAIPFCPKCEEPPVERACLHVPLYGDDRCGV